MLVTATSYATIINNLVARPVSDDEQHFGMGAAFVSDWHPRSDVWVLQGVEQDKDWNIYVLRTAGITAGGDKVFEVTADGCVLGETKGLKAAMCIALDYVTAPALAQIQMNELDPCAV